MNEDNQSVHAEPEAEPEAEQKQKITLKNVIAAEIQDLVSASKKLKTQIQESKTSFKKKYYTKKIKKNNERLIEMMVAFEKLDKRTRGVANESK